MNATLRDKYLHDGPASDYPPYKWLLTVTGQTHSSFMAQLEKGNSVLKEIESRGLLAQCTESMEDGNIKRKLEYKMRKLAAGYKLLFFQEYLISYSPHFVRTDYWDDSPYLPVGTLPTLCRKTALALVHPNEDRFVSIRELIHLMGLPAHFEVLQSEFNAICQGVHCKTAQVMMDKVTL